MIPKQNMISLLVGFSFPLFHTTVLLQASSTLIIQGKTIKDTDFHQHLSQIQQYFQSLDKNNITLFFDFHDVCARKTWRNAINNLGTTEQTTQGKLKLLASAFLACCNLRTYTSLWKTHKKQKNSTESYFNVLKKLGYENLYNEAIAFTNNLYEENEATLTLLIKLKNAGYSLALLSNIGPSVLKDAIIKKRYPTILPLFNNSNAVNNQIPEDGIIKHTKPDPKVYEIALENHAAQPNHAIMIDDNKTNLSNTWAAGIIFKNAQQCETDLKLLGLSF